MGAGGGGGEGRKRYSSSFGHRYKESLGGASEVSAGSAERKERESDKGGVSFSISPYSFTYDLIPNHD